MFVKNKQKNKVKYLTPRSRKPGALALLGRHVAFSCVLVSFGRIAVFIIDFSGWRTIHCSAKHPPGLNSSPTISRALQKTNDTRLLSLCITAAGGFCREKQIWNYLTPRRRRWKGVLMTSDDDQQQQVISWNYSIEPYVDCGCRRRVLLFTGRRRSDQLMRGFCVESTHNRPNLRWWKELVDESIIRKVFYFGLFNWI